MIAVLLASCSCLAFATRYDLGGTDWQFRSSNGTIRGSAVVPGDIYQDLQQAGIIGEPLYGEGDVDLRWVPRTDWVYERTFDVPTLVAAKGKNVYLYANGLDTVAAVYLNDALLGRTYNQYLEYRYDVSKHLTSSGNHLRIEFQSPVFYAQNQSSSFKGEYSHSIPPDCPPDVYNGECNANFIRKAQASFSWDWGPSFPTVGIWRPIYLESFDSVHIERVSPLITAGADSFAVAVDAHILCAPEVTSVRVSLTIPELRIEQNSTVPVNCVASANQSVRASVSVNKNKVKLWYPHGYGEPKLYKLRLLVQADGGPASKKVVSVGFRTIELVQDLIDANVESKGRHFYFKVNGIPIFLKGTNWIPVSSFPARNHRLRRRFHLDSLVDANMNSVRIWGGGLYEDDDFYDHCDRNGILIWHDFMFACAAYPTNKAFLDSVSQEIESQVYRLRHRPSILIWGGNNENELAIQTGWWYELGYSQADMIKDYKTLYKDLMKPLVTSLDASRPFVLSSPSDGIETERQGGLAQNPGDNLYGDVHFYNEAVNLWQDQSYPIPRCATEYGVQSIPLRSTMLKWINASEWHYGSKSLTQRQHHPGGVINQLMMAFQHFEVPSQCGNVSPGDLLACDYVKNSAKFMNRFAFLSQIHQALAIQTETEHYRRWRARLQDDGKGNTMCAMYWQLNDVWAAPTWSSIDFNLNWKPLHYAAKRFFSNVALSMFIDGSNTVQVFVVSDLTKPLFSQYFRLDMFTWTNGFEPLYSIKKVISVPQLASKQIDIGDGLLKTLRDKDQQDFLIRAQVFASNGDPVTYPSVLVPDKLYKTDLFGDVSLADFEKQNATTYAITLNATSIVPFVWLDLRDELKDSRLLFWFSDNAFVITASSTKVKLVIYVNPENLTISQNDITLCSLKTC